MKPKYKRLQLILIIITCISLGLWLILKNFNDNIVFFFSPTELKAHPTNQIIRVGGLVKSESIKKYASRPIAIRKLDSDLRDERAECTQQYLSTRETDQSDSSITEFIITDQLNELTIHYEGILPNLFREGQGIVAKGRLQDDIFIAEELLAKHDENYMPKEVAKALKDSGNWRESK